MIVSLLFELIICIPLFSLLAYAVFNRIEEHYRLINQYWDHGPSIDDVFTQSVTLCSTTVNTDYNDPILK